MLRVLRVLCWLLLVGVLGAARSGRARAALQPAAATDAAPPAWQPGLAGGAAAAAARPAQPQGVARAAHDAPSDAALRSVPSRRLEDPDALGVRLVALDFDGSTVVDNVFSPGNVARCVALDPACRGARLAEIVSATSPAEVTARLGGPARRARLRQFLSGLREAGVRIVILSTSFQPVSAESWCEYLWAFSELAGLGFAREHIECLEDPGGDTPADKGAVMARLLQSLGLAPHQGVLLDDSRANIDKLAGRCDWLWLAQRTGYSHEEMEYVEARAGLVHGAPPGSASLAALLAVLGGALATARAWWVTRQAALKLL